MFRVFRNIPDYRTREARRVTEIDLSLFGLSLRLMINTRPGLSLWTARHRQIARLNYPAT